MMEFSSSAEYEGGWMKIIIDLHIEKMKKMPISMVSLYFYAHVYLYFIINRCVTWVF